MKERRQCGREWKGIGLIGILIVSFIIKLLWNLLIPELFGGPMITYWQAVGLLILSKILTGGFRGRYGGGTCDHKGYWRTKIKQKMESMSPEERQRFKEGFKGKCWEVNVWEVEDKDEQTEEGTDNGKKDGGGD